MSTDETWAQQEEPPPTPSPRPFGAIVTGVLLVVIGGLWLLDVSGVVQLRLAIILPAALAVIGIALIAGSFRGPHSGLVVAGVFLTIATLVLALVPVGVGSGMGERQVQVGQQAQLEPRYDLALGKLTIDLRELDLIESAEVQVSVGAGEVRVFTPPDTPIRVEASVGAGELEVMGERADGLSPSITYTSPDYEGAATRLTLRVGVGAGKIEVRR